MVNLYQLLGIDINADSARIRAAIASAREEGKINAEVLDKAATWLLDAQIRQRYDAQLRQQEPNLATDNTEKIDTDGIGHSRLSAPTVLTPRPALIQQNATTRQPDNAPISGHAQAAAEQQQLWFEALVGERKSDYYLQQFDVIGQGGRGDFNWSVFWGGCYWFCVRGMWGAGLATLFAPIAALLLWGLLSVIIGKAGVIAVVAWLLWRLLWLPRQANHHYYRFAQKRIRQLQLKYAHKPERMLKVLRTTTNWGAGVAMLAVVAFCSIPILGIAAAIILPMYQDSIVRQKMTMGYQELLALKPAIESQLQQSGVAQSDDANAQGYIKLSNSGSFGHKELLFDEEGVGHVWGEWSGTDARSQYMNDVVLALERDNVGLWRCLVYDGHDVLRQKHLPRGCELAE